VSRFLPSNKCKSWFKLINEKIIRWNNNHFLNNYFHKTVAKDAKPCAKKCDALTQLSNDVIQKYFFLVLLFGSFLSIKLNVFSFTAGGAKSDSRHKIDFDVWMMSTRIDFNFALKFIVQLIFMWMSPQNQEHTKLSIYGCTPYWLLINLILKWTTKTRSCRKSDTKCMQRCIWVGIFKSKTILFTSKCELLYFSFLN
jgi:hypothetical protein